MTLHQIEDRLIAINDEIHGEGGYAKRFPRIVWQNMPAVRKLCEEYAALEAAREDFYRLNDDGTVATAN